MHNQEVRGAGKPVRQERPYSLITVSRMATPASEHR
jgi:hypothetical protein